MKVQHTPAYSFDFYYDHVDENDDFSSIIWEKNEDQTLQGEISSGFALKIVTL